MKGTTRSIDDQGTIVTLWVGTPTVYNGQWVTRDIPVHFDHRMFQHLVGARGDRGILGQEVEILEAFPSEGSGLTVRFLDEEDGQ